jgi:hypothetical protein
MDPQLASALAGVLLRRRQESIENGVDPTVRHISVFAALEEALDGLEAQDRWLAEQGYIEDDRLRATG